MDVATTLHSTFTLHSSHLIALFSSQLIALFSSQLIALFSLQLIALFSLQLIGNYTRSNVFVKTSTLMTVGETTSYFCR